MIPGRQYSPEDLLRLLWIRRWIVFGAVFICAGSAIVMSARLTNIYRSETVILVVPQRVPESYVRSTVTMRIEDRLRSISEQIRSRSRLEKVISDFDLYPEMRGKAPMEEIVRRMNADLQLETVRDDSFKVSFLAEAPRTAMIVADRLAAMFIAENARDREGMADGTNQFLESQLEDARRRLVEHERKLEDFRRRYSGELPSQLESNLQVISGTQTQIQSFNESIDRDRDRRLVLERSVADSALSGSAYESPSSDGTAPVSLRAVDQLERARAELRGLELRLKPGHPDVTAKKRAVADLDRRVQDENAAGDPQAGPKPTSSAEVIRQARSQQARTEIAKLDRQIAQKEGEVQRLKLLAADYQRRVDSVPGHESEMTALMRDYETIQKIYTNLLGKKEDSKISANLERQQVGEQFKILDRARLPEQPHSPDRPRIAMVATAIGLIIGIALAGFQEYRDTSLRSEEEIVKMLALPVVAVIPVMSTVGDRRRQRRNLIAMGVGCVLLIIGAAAATLWRIGLLTGLG